MTAQRWWVALFARWQARIDAIKGQIQAVSLAVTAFSTFSLVLQGAGLGGYIPYLGIILAIVGPAYAYYFFEGGVWNQVSRDRADMSSNFAGPGARISTEMQARALAAAMQGEQLSPDQRRAIKHEADIAFDEFRDGVALQASEVRDDGSSPSEAPDEPEVHTT
jgi:hypothetical protein